MLRSALRNTSSNIIVFALTDMLGNFARSMVFPYFSLYILALGGNAAEIGLVSGLGQLAGLVLLPVAGYVADRSSRIAIIGLAGFLSLGFQIINIIAPDWRYLALAAFLSGMVVIVFPAYSSLIADSLSTEARGRGIGLMNTISSSLMIVGPYIAGLVIQRHGNETGMRILYGILTGLYFSCTLIQIRLLKEPDGRVNLPIRPRELLAALGDVYRGIPGLVRGMSRPLIALTGVIILAFLAHALNGAFWVVYATQIQQLSAPEWGLVLLVETLVKWFLMMPAGLVVDRWGRTRALVAALALFCVGTPLYILACGMPGVLAVRILLSIPFVLAIPACTALLADLAPRRERGKIMAAIGQGGIMLGGIGAPGGPAIGYLIIPPLMIASLSGGLFYDLNPALPWLLSTVLGAAALGLTLAFIRDPHRAEA